MRRELAILNWVGSEQDEQLRRATANSIVAQSAEEKKAGQQTTA
ncbi:MAG: hypothetical protein WCL11_24485 [Verrucomicrobiota bacterium]